MRVDVSMTVEKDEFNVSSWWAKNPQFVINSLRSQMEAAAVVWPELKEYGILKRRNRKKSKEI